MKYHITTNQGAAVALDAIPEVSYAAFYDDLCARLADARYHVGHYFALPSGDRLRFFCLLLDDASGEVLITSHALAYYEEQHLPSVTARREAMHPFERDIAERFGVRFSGMPWDKPLRFAFDRRDRRQTIDNYPFYKIEGGSLHEVNVGPIHAGIIEPGAFRFICNGEQVLHLEIALGYQHRGLEHELAASSNRLRQMCLAEAAAGDSAVAHAAAMAMAVEKLTGGRAIPQLDAERAVALELERMAMHIADTGALCMDIAYQLGQVACEALRTLVINTTQWWCGNRFGKGLIRPCGTNYPLTAEKRSEILNTVTEVARRFDEVQRDLQSSPTVLARFEQCGIVGRGEALRIGCVGQAARASGLVRDIRATHPWGAYALGAIGGGLRHEPVVHQHGDVMARLTVRCNEVLQSARYIEQLLGGGNAAATHATSATPATAAAPPASAIPAPAATPTAAPTAAPLVPAPSLLPPPDFCTPLAPSSLSFGLVEGWRGETCHVVITDPSGAVAACRIKDPSLHNWLALALSMRGEGISDFPICNKSFNLSYCGHDL